MSEEKGDRSCARIKDLLPVIAKAHSECSESLASIAYEKSVLSDEQVASYLNATVDISKHKNEFLLLGSYYGRTKLCRWLISLGADVNYKPRKSCNVITPLAGAMEHCFVDTAMLLLKHGADLEDKQGRSVLDCVYRNVPEGPSIIECHTWGPNAYYSLGFKTMKGRETPEYLDYFRKHNIRVERVHMSKYHTVFLSECGKVYGCGIDGGRLGMGIDGPIVSPMKIDLEYDRARLTCYQVAIGRYHSMFMCIAPTNMRMIMACGVNMYHQLGIAPTGVNVLGIQRIPVHLEPYESIEGIAAATYHSIFWTKRNVYACGFHGGQLGLPHSKDQTVYNFTRVPIELPDSKDITYVTASDGATVVLVGTYDLYIFTEYKKIRINLKKVDSDICDQTRERMPALCFSVYGGNLDTMKNKSMPHVDLKLFYRVDKKLYAYSASQEIFVPFQLPSHFASKGITDYVINKVGMMIISDGFLYSLTWDSGESQIDDNYEKIDQVCYGKRIFTDPDGGSFAVLQRFSPSFVDQAVVAEEVEKEYYKILTARTPQVSCVDNYHDVVFWVGEKDFPAHLYVIRSSSALLNDITTVDGWKYISVLGIHPTIFEQILTYIYTKRCSLIQVGSDALRVSSEMDRAERILFMRDMPEPVLVLAGKNSWVYTKRPSSERDFYLAEVAAYQLGLTDLLDALRCFGYRSGKVVCKSSAGKFDRGKCLAKFDREKCPTLADVEFVTLDKETLYGHKCILRSYDYFDVLISARWNLLSSSNDYTMPEIVTVELPMKANILTEILNFCYTGDVSNAMNPNFNFWCSLMSYADQFLLFGLKVICEQKLSMHIDSRNVLDMYSYAKMCSATHLQKACFDFIALNMKYMLQYRILENLEDEELVKIGDAYRNLAVRSSKASHTKSGEQQASKSSSSSDSDVFNNEYLPKYLKVEEGVEEQQKYVSCVKAAHASNPVDITAAEKPKDVRSPKTSPKKQKAYAKKQTRRHKKSSPSPKNETDVKSVNEHEGQDLQQVLSPLTSSEEEQEESEEEDDIDDDYGWIPIDNAKAVKARLKTVTAAQNCPEMLEMPDNFTLLETSQNSVSDGVKDRRSSSSAVDVPVVVDDKKSMPTKSSPIIINLSELVASASSRKESRSKTDKKMTPSTSGANDTSHDGVLTPISRSPDVARSPPSPWNINKKKNDATLSDIMASEMNQKKSQQKNVLKMREKTLEQMQTEDKAIQELMVFYNAKFATDEYITVQRVLPDVHITPRWTDKNKGKK